MSSSNNGVGALRQKPVFPFTAIVGQEELKLALQLCVIDPTIGGVLVMGHRGTGKSTAVRALAALLPHIAKVVRCPYNCDPADPSPLCPHCTVQPEATTDSKIGPVPVVDLPLGATEDRLAGSLDVERALVEGVQAFAPGLLAKANRGFLYIDEVNLLEDHLVDLLLDVAASGVNVVEREGISIRHPARFVLVGSGNPEEGDLRPQLLDRFGLHARITTIHDIDERVEIVRRRRAYDTDPYEFAARWEPEQEKLREKLTHAKNLVGQVALSDETIETAARLCVELEVDGHRGELTLCRAAVALAALDGRTVTTAEDIISVATMSLQHRLRKDPLESVGDDVRVTRAVKKITAPGQVSDEPALVPEPAAVTEVKIEEPAVPEEPTQKNSIVVSAAPVDVFETVDVGSGAESSPALPVPITVIESTDETIPDFDALVTSAEETEEEWSDGEFEELFEE